MVLQVALSSIFSTLLCTCELTGVLTIVHVPPSRSFVSAAVTSCLQALACMRLIGQAQHNHCVCWHETNWMSVMMHIQLMHNGCDVIADVT